MKEVWKDIKGYEGVYRISNYGNIYSYSKNKLLSRFESKDRHGNPFRIRVNLLKDGKNSIRMLHRLVYESFIGEIKTEIDFKDGDFRNCRVDNLIETKYTSKQRIFKNKRVLDTKTMKMYDTMLDLSLHLGLTPGSVNDGFRKNRTKYKRYKLI